MNSPTAAAASPLAGLDLSPAPGAAPVHRRVLGHAATEVRLLVRNGEQLLLALVIPAGLLLAGHLFADRLGRSVAVGAPSVLALALWSSGFTSVAIATGFERRYGVLERLASTPLRRSGLVLGKGLATATVALGQLLVLSALALVLGWRPTLSPLGVLAALLGVVLALVTFSALALALAGRLRAEATLALANLVYLLVAAGGALVLPLSAYPSGWAAVVRWLPTAALGELLRSVTVGTPLLWPLLVLAGWTVLAVGLAAKGLRWC